MTDHKHQAYALLRIALGVNFLAHGLVRLPKLAGFANGIAESFADTILPQPAVLAFGYVIPIAETVLGLLLVIGLLSRYTLIASFLLMIALIFGSCLLENWETVGLQVVYTVVLFLLLFYQEYNGYALDSRNHGL